MKLAAALILLVACSDDAPGTPLTYTGGYEDWDSTDNTFLGVFEATVTEVAHPDNTATTAPNGRSTLELPGDTISQVTWDKAGYLTGRATVDPATGLGVYDLRGLAETRVDSFFTELGDTTYDPARVLVLIEVRDAVSGAARDGVTIGLGNAGDAYHDDADHAWQPGATTAGGRYVVFPNVIVPASGELTVVTDDGCDAPETVHAVAGEVAMATVYCE
jgi:hypothetical protein